MKQTLTIEQMRHLKELGLELKPSLLHYWQYSKQYNGEENENKWRLTTTEGDITEKNRYYDYLPAYTLADIIEMLPKQLEDPDGIQNRLQIFYNETIWEVSYYSEVCETSYIYKTGEDVIDAAYEMLCWCLENKYIETKEKKTMRIIKEGKLPHKEKEMTCPECGCVFMYDLYSDIHSDQWNDFVICPTCKTPININGRG